MLLGVFPIVTFNAHFFLLLTTVFLWLKENTMKYLIKTSFKKFCGTFYFNEALIKKKLSEIGKMAQQVKKSFHCKDGILSLIPRTHGGNGESTLDCPLTFRYARQHACTQTQINTHTHTFNSCTAKIEPRYLELVQTLISKEDMAEV